MTTKANLLLRRVPGERTAALRAVAGGTEFGRVASVETTADLRRRGVPVDLGIDPDTATRDVLAAQSDRRPRPLLRRPLRAVHPLPLWLCGA